MLLLVVYWNRVYTDSKVARTASRKHVFFIKSKEDDKDMLTVFKDNRDVFTLFHLRKYFAALNLYKYISIHIITRR